MRPPLTLTLSPLKSGERGPADGILQLHAHPHHRRRRRELADRRGVRDCARGQARGDRGGGAGERRHGDRTRRVRALRALRRDGRRACAMPSSPCAAPSSDRAEPAAADAAGRRPQRARLRAVGLRGQALRHAGRTARRPRPAEARVTTAYTISLDSAEAMAASAAAAAARTMPLLKLKLGGAGDDGAPAPGPRRVPARAPRSPTPTRPGRRSCCPRSWPLPPRPASS